MMARSPILPSEDPGRSKTVKASRGSVLATACIATACLLLTSCTPKYTPLALQRTKAGVQVLWLACSAARHHGIRDLELFLGDHNVDTKTHKPIWEIHSTTDSPATNAILGGAAPTGFITDIALQQPLQPQATYTLIANDTSGDVWAYVTVRPEVLAQGKVVFGDNTAKAAADYNAISDTSFGCP